MNLLRGSINYWLIFKSQKDDPEDQEKGERGLRNLYGLQREKQFQGFYMHLGPQILRLVVFICYLLFFNFY